MTHKDYEAIARIIAKHDIGSEEEDMYGSSYREADPSPFISELADYMSADNVRFDRERFIRACYGEGVPT